MFKQLSNGVQLYFGTINTKKLPFGKALSRCPRSSLAGISKTVTAGVIFFTTIGVTAAAISSGVDSDDDQANGHGHGSGHGH